MRSQPEAIRAHCDRLGLVLTEVIADGGESSKTMDRVGLQKALGLLQSGDVVGIAVAHIDRLTRNLRDACELVDRYFTRPGGPEIVSAGEPVDTRSAVGRLQFYILIVVSQFARESGVERTREVLSTKRTSSERLGRDRFGSKVDPANPRRSKTNRPIGLIADEQDLAALAQIHQLRAAGLSLRAIAGQLDSLGYKPKRGGAKWSPSTVDGLLKKSPSNHGDPFDSESPRQPHDLPSTPGPSPDDRPEDPSRDPPGFAG